MQQSWIAVVVNDAVGISGAYRQTSCDTCSRAHPQALLCSQHRRGASRIHVHTDDQRPRSHGAQRVQCCWRSAETFIYFQFWI
jgi:hypothetical protein